MNPRQLQYFREKLVAWRAELADQAQHTLNDLRDDIEARHEVGDIADDASREENHTLDLRARDRHRQLLSEIDAALARIDEGGYGYCEETGEPIGLRRLEARPTTTLSLEAQERRELSERQSAGE